MVAFIRDKAKDYSEKIVWYLFWFGLESEQPVFFSKEEAEKALERSKQ